MEIYGVFVFLVVSIVIVVALVSGVYVLVFFWLLFLLLLKFCVFCCHCIASSTMNAFRCRRASLCDRLKSSIVSESFVQSSSVDYLVVKTLCLLNFNQFSQSDKTFSDKCLFSPLRGDLFQFRVSKFFIWLIVAC